MSDMPTPLPPSAEPSIRPAPTTRRPRRSFLSPDVSEILSMLEAYEGDDLAATRR
ncbi:MAG TPA: hypothetical protein VJS40_07870 [Aestuariivirgaceae bacterium]|nr:hypothetical protein [Aestuariivirgaceae bacterium]